jgi:ABC-type amino acid transport substrate-binding protein
MWEAINFSTDHFRSIAADWRGSAGSGAEVHCVARAWMLSRLVIVGLLTASFVIVGCSRKQTPAPAEQSKAQPQSKSDSPDASTPLVPNESGGSGQGSLTLPTGFGRRTGDLDEMVKQRSIRALTIVNKVGFFYQMGRPQGIQYEALREFEKFVNQKMKTGRLPVQVVFLPMRPDQLEAALTQGLGDLIAYGVAITPEREKSVAFSIPIQKNVPEVVVTGPALSGASSFDDLANKPIYVNPVTVYYSNLKAVSDAQQKAGKPPLDIKAADKN